MKKILLFLVTMQACCMTPGSAQDIVNLEGAWDLSLGDSTHYNDYVFLPGSLLTNGKGNKVTVNTQWTGSLYDSSYYFNPYMKKYQVEGNLKFPFFLTPEYHYVGKAWYKKTIYVPEDWDDKRITLFLERAHIETTLFVNGREVGHEMSLSTPHRFDVTKYIKAGRRNTIVLCVYNGIENVCVGQDSHSVTDQTQGNWNGIIGRMELQAQWKKVNIKQVRVFPAEDLNSFKVVVDLEEHVADLRVMPIFDYFCDVTIYPVIGGDIPPRVRPVWQGGKHADRSKVVFEFPTGFRQYTRDGEPRVDCLLWDEFSPNYYHMVVEAGDDVYETTFGLRSITTEGRQLMINKRPLFLRGTVENCCFPETGYPPTDKEAWLRIFKKCKEYGLNHMRFHSYCPPEAAFAAADQVGIFLQPEGPSWPNHGVKLRRGQKIDQYLLEESKRIIDTYGNHPSFVMMAAGNEPAGDWVPYCNEWVQEMKKHDPTKLYCGASVGGGWAWDSGSEYHVKGGARGLDWDNHAPHSDDDYYSQIEYPRNYKDTAANQSPIIAHEQGQWCAFPSFREISQYTGVYKARSFEIFRDLLRNNGMERQAEDFLMASGKLQTLCYKYEIERNLRTKDYAGFQLLGLSDYSGQGTALEGVLNVHWREKGYTTAEEWREFCFPIVPLARFPKFVYSNRDTLVVPIEAYNAIYGTVGDIRTTYYIHNDSNKVLAGGQIYSGNLPIGKNTPIGTVRFPLDSISQPSKLTLVVNLSGKLKNHWDFWVYPEGVNSEKGIVNSEERIVNSEEGIVNSEKGIVNSEEGIVKSDIHVADTLDSKALSVLRKGGKVLLTAAGKVRLGRDVVQHYLPVFWNTSWFKMRPPHTTGAYINKQHPLFKYDFPTDSWSNLNWWELLNRAQVMNLMELPADYQPPIQPIDTWHVSRKLGMLIEANVLKGKLLMTTMDIDTDLDHRLVARQMRQAILAYMQSDDFKPTITLQPKTITNFFTKDAPRVDMFTKDSPDELKPKLK